MSTSGEFDRIARFFAPLTTGFDGAAGLKDDAAVFSIPTNQELVVTTDTIVETVHFLGQEDPSKIGQKLLRVNLSDLTAKGAVPRWYTLNVAVPSRVEDSWFEAFSAGLRADQDRYGVVLAGGDTVRTDGLVVLTLTAFGTVHNGSAVRRSGASPGDRLFVTGTIGDAALGLRCAKGEFPDLSWKAREALVARYEVPDPPVGFGPALSGVASASLDISDGLIADAGHLAAASDVGITIRTPSVPVSDAVADILAQDVEQMIDVLTGGDDYQVLCTVAPEYEDEFRRQAYGKGISVTEIGEVETGHGVKVLDQDGAPIRIARPGYVHS